MTRKLTLKKSSTLYGPAVFLVMAGALLAAGGAPGEALAFDVYHGQLVRHTHACADLQHYKQIAKLRDTENKRTVHREAHELLESGKCTELPNKAHVTILKTMPTTHHATLVKVNDTGEEWWVDGRDIKHNK